jgi:hypothetical protein
VQDDPQLTLTIVEDDQPEPLLTTDDDFVEATQKLVASKNLEDV